MKTLTSRVGPQLPIAVIAMAVAVSMTLVLPSVAMGVDAYRADTGSYAEEGHGLLHEFLPYTEVGYRADTGSYTEEGHGLIH